MKTCVQSFMAGVNELHAFLVATEHETELISLLLQRQPVLEDRENYLLTQIASASTDRKRYIYTVAIVSLYGLLERFVDELIEAFVARIAGLVSSYDEMPEPIRKNHVSMSLALALAIAEDRHRTGATQETVVANLHSCLSGASKFQVNGAAFVLHRGNISLEKITKYLANVGVQSHLRRVTLARELLEYYYKQDPERDIRNAADQDLSALLMPIDDLVMRRNQVSHGVINVDDVVSVELLKERCRFVAAYGCALYDVLLQEVLKYLVIDASVKRLGKPLAVYNNSIVCFEIDHCSIVVGDVLAAETGDLREPFRFGPISSLEIERQSHTEINAIQSVKIGAKVSFKADKRFDYYVLPNGVI